MERMLVPPDTQSSCSCMPCTSSISLHPAHQLTAGCAAIVTLPSDRNKSAHTSIYDQVVMPRCVERDEYMSTVADAADGAGSW